MFTLLNFNPQCSYWRIWDECVILFIFSYFKQNQVESLAIEGLAF